MNVFTRGYGGRTQEEVLALLKANGVRTVVDIRLRPDRVSVECWAKAKTADPGIERWLTDAGLGFRPLIELGNPFMDDSNGRLRYQALRNVGGDLLTHAGGTSPARSARGAPKRELRRVTDSWWRRCWPTAGAQRFIPWNQQRTGVG